MPWHHGSVNAEQVAALRELLAPTGWVERAATFARALRTSTRTPGGLLVVGTPQEEPWHLTAHLDEESRLGGIPELAPTLVRWSAPPGAPLHLSVTLQRLEAARRGGVNPPFSCEMGNCATCMAHLDDGSVTMRANNALTPDEVDAGWVLTCQSLPTSSTVAVNYDA